MSTENRMYNKRIFYTILITSIIVTAFLASYILLTNRVSHQNPVVSPTTKTTTYTTPPNLITNRPSIPRVSMLYKTAFSEPLNRLSTQLINGCLDIPRTYRYRCLPDIEKLLSRYRIGINLNNPTSLDVYRVFLRYNESVIDYVAYFGKNYDYIMLSLKNGEPYSFYKVYTWGEFNNTVKGFNPEKYMTYSINYVAELLYNTTGINLSHYGEPYILYKNLFRNIKSERYGYFNEISYMIGFKIDDHDVLVASSPPYFRLSVYFFIQYNDKNVMVGYKRNHNPPVLRDNILEGKKCSFDLSGTLDSILKSKIIRLNVLESKDIYFIKPLKEDFYYAPGRLVKLTARTPSSSYMVLVLFDLSSCALYDYVAARQ